MPETPNSRYPRLNSSNSGLSAAEKLFGLTHEQAVCLFLPSYNPARTPKEVAAVIRSLMKNS